MLDFNLNPPHIMGVLNITPDSMLDGGQYLQLADALARSEEMIQEGVAMIDIGGESTRPNAQPVTVEVELQRVLPVIKAIRKQFSIPLSIDTSQPVVMRAAIEHGVNMINDVRALRVPGALATAAQLNVPICLMHMSYPFGKPDGAVDPLGNEPMAAIIDFFHARITACEQAGIAREKLLIDPGFGGGSFGKSPKQNVHILKNMAQLTQFKLPILVGLSYKSFISALLDVPLPQRLPGALAATVLAMIGGATIVRTHDVPPTLQVVRLVHAVDTAD